MDKERQEIQDKIAAAGGHFDGWLASLLEVSPKTALHVYNAASLAEKGGPLSEKMQHLIWQVADSTVTHLFPLGTGVHVRMALKQGATVKQVMQAFEIAAVCSSGYRHGLPIIVEAAAEAGCPLATQPMDAKLRQQVTERIGYWSDWMETAASVTPEAFLALIELAPTPGDSEGLDARSRELLYFAGYASPAVLNQEGMRRHARAALAAGATPQELIQTLRLSDNIALHAVIVGINCSGEHLKKAMARPAG